MRSRHFRSHQEKCHVLTLRVTYWVRAWRCPNCRWNGCTVSCSTPPPANSPAPVAGQSVTAAPVRLGSVTRTIDVTGSVAAYDLLPILPEATGLQIQQVLADEGSKRL